MYGAFVSIWLPAGRVPCWSGELIAMLNAGEPVWLARRN